MDQATFQLVMAEIQEAIDAAPRANNSVAIAPANRLTIQRVINDAITTAKATASSDLQRTLVVTLSALKLIFATI